MSAYTAEIVKELTFGENAPVDCFTFCPRGEKLAIKFESGAISVVDISTSETIEFEGSSHELQYGGITFTPDGKHIVCGHRVHDAAIFDLERPGDPLYVILFAAILKDVAITRDGKTIVTASANTVSTWDLQTGALNRRYADHPDNTLFNRVLPLDEDGNRVVAISDNGSLWILEAAEGIARSGELRLVCIHHAVLVTIYCMYMMPDNKHFVTGSKDGRISFWKADSGERIRSVKTLGAISSISCMPDGCTLLMHGGKRDGALARHDIWTQAAVYEHGEPRVLIDREDASDIIMSTASPDCSLLATGVNDGSVSIWRVSLVEMKRAGRKI
jgi:WD40 repeat protein